MFRLLRRPANKQVAAWLCGCWVALTLVVPLAQSVRMDDGVVTTDCVSASVPASAPYSDTSVDESSLRLSPAVTRIDFGGFAEVVDPLLGCSIVSDTLCARQLSGANKSTLLDLGIALRL